MTGVTGDKCLPGVGHSLEGGSTLQYIVVHYSTVL